jgi:hypothetical protein
MRAEAGDDVAQPALEAVELATRHRGEERTRERSMIALELDDQPLARWSGGHERRPPVGRMSLARYETAFNECVNEPGYRPRRHVQRFGQDTLRHRPMLPELPEQLRARRSEAQSLDRARHVVVQQND